MQVNHLQSEGVRFAGGIRKGAGGHEVAFIHPKVKDDPARTAALALRTHTHILSPNLVLTLLPCVLILVATSPLTLTLISVTSLSRMYLTHAYIHTGLSPVNPPSLALSHTSCTPLMTIRPPSRSTAPPSSPPADDARVHASTLWRFQPKTILFCFIHAYKHG